VRSTRGAPLKAVQDLWLGGLCHRLFPLLVRSQGSRPQPARSICFGQYFAGGGCWLAAWQVCGGEKKTVLRAHGTNLQEVNSKRASRSRGRLDTDPIVRRFPTNAANSACLQLSDSNSARNRRAFSGDYQYLVTPNPKGITGQELPISHSSTTG
jgi:hypothetical protein